MASFRYIPRADFLALADLVTADSIRTDFDADDVRTLDAASFWRSESEDSAYLEFSLDDAAAVPGVIAAINTRALVGQEMDLLEGGTLVETFADGFPWNRIQVAEFAGTAGSTLRLRFQRNSPAEWQCGTIIAAEKWRSIDSLASMNVSNQLSQLKSDSETGSPILSQPSGRRRKVSLTFQGDIDDDLKPVYAMFDELEDRNQVALFQPNTAKPFYFYGRLDSWSYAGTGSNLESVGCEIVTDGLGQQVNDA